MVRVRTLVIVGAILVAIGAAAWKWHDLNHRIELLNDRIDNMSWQSAAQGEAIRSLGGKL